MTTSDPRFAQLLSILHREGTYGYWWINPGKHTIWWQAGKHPAIPKGDVNVYFNVNPTTQRKAAGQRTKIEDIAAINCFYGDYDAKDYDGDKAAALDHIEVGLSEIGIPRPSVCIDTGGGYQGYWLLDTPYVLDSDEARSHADNLQKRWVAYTGADDSVKDLARVLRVPGSHNQKYEDKPLVTFMWCDLDRLYTLDELTALLPPEPPKETYTPIRSSRIVSTDHLRRWCDEVVSRACNGALSAPNGKGSDVRVEMGKLAGGLLHTGVYTEDQLVDMLMPDALKRSTDNRQETERNLRNGIAYGRASPLDVPPFPTDQALVIKDSAAHCPSCGSAIVRSKYDYPGTTTSGWYCPRCKGLMVWPLEAYTPTKDLQQSTNGPAETAQPTEYATAPPVPIAAPDLAQKVIEPTRYFIPDVLRAGLALYIGNPGIGKTPALMQLAIAFACGGRWLGALPCRKSRVLYIGVEYDEAYIKEVMLDSVGRADLPPDLFILSLETFTSPVTEEESIQLLDYYLRVMGIEVVIIDVFSGYLPREKFKQNAYRGDYAEFLAYHRLCMHHKALLVGAWHGGKHNKDPETAYNGGQGMWGSAGGGRLTMFFDDDQQVRIRSQLRGHERMEWLLEQARVGDAHFWSVVDADPDPILSSVAQRRIFTAVKNNGSPTEPITPAGVRAVLRADNPEETPADPYIRNVLSRMAERGILFKIGGGYIVKRRDSRDSRDLDDSRDSDDSPAEDTNKSQCNIRTNHRDSLLVGERITALEHTDASNPLANQANHIIIGSQNESTDQGSVNGSVQSITSNNDTLQLRKTQSLEVHDGSYEDPYLVRQENSLWALVYRPTGEIVGMFPSKPKALLKCDEANEGHQWKEGD